MPGGLTVARLPCLGGSALFGMVTVLLPPPSALLCIRVVEVLFRMHLSRRSLLILGTAFLAGCSSIAPPVPGNTAPTQLTQGAILAAINDTRQRNGKPPLRYSGALEAAARTQADLMASRDALSHDLGLTLRQRVTAAGYQGAVGENVAGGQKTLEQAIDGWLASPGHRATLLSTKFVEFGLAAAHVPAGRKSRYGTYWAFVAGGPFEAWM